MTISCLRTAEFDTRPDFRQSLQSWSRILLEPAVSPILNVYCTTQTWHPVKLIRGLELYPWKRVGFMTLWDLLDDLKSVLYETFCFLGIRSARVAELPLSLWMLRCWEFTWFRKDESVCVLLSQNKIVGVELEVSRAFCQRNPGKYLRRLKRKWNH
jgi:hypothetical protein